MPSVLGLAGGPGEGGREEVARSQEETQVAPGDAGRALQRLTDARATGAEVLAEPPSTVTGRASTAAGRGPWRRWSSRRTTSGSCRCWSRKRAARACAASNWPWCGRGCSPRSPCRPTEAACLGGVRRTC